MQQEPQLEQLFSDCQTHFRPPPERSVTDWAEEFVVISGGHRSGHFQLRNSPWLRRPLEDFRRTDCRELVTVCGARSSKTTGATLGLLWSLANDPGEALWVLPNKTLAEDFSTDTLQPLLFSTAPVARLLEGRKHQRLHFDIPGAPLILTGAGGAKQAQLSARTCRRVFIDEADKISSAAISEAIERTQTYWHGKIWLLGCPNTTADILYSKWLESTQNVWMFECLACGEPLPLVWSSRHCRLLPDDLAKKSWMTWDKSARLVNGTWDYRKAAESARLVCGKCGAEHRDEPKVRKAILQGDFVALNPSGAIPGYTWSAMLPDWREWGDLVSDFLQATDATKFSNTERLKKFVNNALGEPWQDGQEVERADVILSGYTLSDAPSKDGWDYRFLTCDVQEKSFWVVIRDWRKNGESRLVYFGELATWGELAQLAEKYQIKNPRHVALDAGYDEKEVLRRAALNGWTCFKGHDSAEDFIHTNRGQKIRRPYSEPQTRDPGIGTQSAKQRYAVLFLWRSDAIRDILERLRTGRGAKWELPANISDEYKRQLAAEQRLEKRNKTTGKYVPTWTRLYRDNHAFDCEAMQVVLACMAGVLYQAPQAVAQAVANPAAPQADVNR